MTGGVRRAAGPGRPCNRCGSAPGRPERPALHPTRLDRRLSVRERVEGTCRIRPAIATPRSVFYSAPRVGQSPVPADPSMSLTHSDIAEIIRLVDQSTLDEIVVEIGDLRVEVRRKGAMPAPSPVPAASAPAAPTPAASPAPQVQPPPSAPRAPAAAEPGQRLGAARRADPGRRAGRGALADGGDLLPASVCGRTSVRRGRWRGRGECAARPRRSHEAVHDDPCEDAGAHRPGLCKRRRVRRVRPDPVHHRFGLGRLAAGRGAAGGAHHETRRKGRIRHRRCRRNRSRGRAPVRGRRRSSRTHRRAHGGRCRAQRIAQFARPQDVFRAAGRRLRVPVGGGGRVCDQDARGADGARQQRRHLRAASHRSTPAQASWTRCSPST